MGEFARPGRYPFGGLLYVPADGNYYGTTAAGGTYDRGTVFRVNPSGQMVTLVSFTGTSGAVKGDSPIAGLVIGPDGALYGTTQEGGAGNFGTVFRITIAGAFSTIVEFTGPSGVAPGAVPHDLLYAPDGFFYGVTEAGGAMELGTVFRMTPTGVISTLVDFSGTSGLRKGSSPVGGLVLIGQVLFGVTETGGAGDLGTIFSVSTNGAWGLVAEFTGVAGARKGSYPSSGLTIHPDGALYGTTASGGTQDAGTIFRFTLSGGFTVLREFSGTDGEHPSGSLLVATDGALYGTTNAGGADDLGTVFKVSSSDGTTWVHSVVAEFSGESGATIGAFPEAGLVFGAAGQLFGTTTAGGPGGFGSVFSIGVNDTFAPFANFTSATGWRPSGGLVASSGGDLLLPLYSGGANGYGTLARIRANGSLSADATFGEPLGQNPEGALVRLGAAFLGVTRAGGANSRGTLFRLDEGVGTFPLTSFNVQGGGRPEGPLAPGIDGFLYGVAREGGSNNKGAIVRLSQDGSRTTLVSFTGNAGTALGQVPRAPLAFGPDGRLYGVTERGGANDQGTIFSLTTDGTLITLLEFSSSGPRLPLGGLSTGPDGMLYGTTSLGGIGGAGTVFRFAPPNTFTVISAFTGAAGSLPGARPAGPLSVALDGTIYGVTTQGADNGFGAIYRVLPNSIAEKVCAFTGASGGYRGAEAVGGLLFAPDGFLYGSTASGGAGGGGAIYRMRQLGPHTGTDSPTFSPGSVVLHGSVQTGGEPTTTSFEYGTTSSLGNFVASTGGNTGTSPISFSAAFGDLVPGMTIFFRATASNASGSSAGIVRSFVIPSPFDAWRLEHFGNASVLATDDTDADGTPNLAEYALIRSPVDPDAAKALIANVKTYSDGVRLSTIVSRDPARADITVEVQAASSATGPWSTLATSSAGGPFAGPGYVGGDSPTPGLKIVEIRDIVDVTEASSRFLRVHVSLP